jgi:serine/threonine protein kinase
LLRSLVGGFELIEEFGRGGIGVVFRARQLVPEREVALKMLRADRLQMQQQDENAQRQERFRREAQFVAAMVPAQISVLAITASMHSVVGDHGVLMVAKKNW